MSKLFENSEINGLELANRFVRSATWEGMATDEGAVTPKLVETMAALARGEVGLIITGHAYILKEGQAGPWQLGVYKDELIGGLKEMTAAIHDCGGKIVMQVSHAGTLTSESLTGQPPMAVSVFEGLSKSPRKEITTQYIKKLVAAFADAAVRAKSAGFDGVQIHSAHGYLLNQFLSPKFNRRQDEYGGDIGNRARIHLEVCRSVRQAVGEDYPILVKLNSSDFAEDGLSLEDSIAVGKMLEEAGIDAIELSGGMLVNKKLTPSRLGINTPEKEAYHVEEARAFKKQIKVPLILVGGIRSLEVAERLVEEGVADYLSMCRPFIREPELVKRWREGDRRKAKCLSDNQCFGPARKGDGVYCVVEEREKAK